MFDDFVIFRVDHHLAYRRVVRAAEQAERYPHVLEGRVQFHGHFLALELQHAFPDGPGSHGATTFCSERRASSKPAHGSFFSDRSRRNAESGFHLAEERSPESSDQLTGTATGAPGRARDRKSVV